MTHSPGETQALAARLAARLEAGDVIWLSGDLGAGKTTFTQGLGRGLDIAVPINSPTFVLIREYKGRLPLYHIDLYRLGDAREVAALGLSDYLAGDGVCVLEWAERLDARGELPGLHIRIAQQLSGQQPDSNLPHPVVEPPHSIAAAPRPRSDVASEIEAEWVSEGGLSGGRADDSALWPLRGETVSGDLQASWPSEGEPRDESARALTLAAAGERAEYLLAALREDNLPNAARN